MLVTGSYQQLPIKLPSFFPIIIIYINKLVVVVVVEVTG